MSEERDCVVELVDDHGVEHGVRVWAECVYEAALKYRGHGPATVKLFWDLWEKEK